jgi:hypothetical protein
MRQQGGKMDSTAFEEKRDVARHECVAAGKWAHFGRPMDNECRILNFSKNGIRISTRTALKPGTTVWYRVEEYLSDSGDSPSFECLRSIAVANAKWCQRQSEALGLRYEIGLKYQ